MLAVLGVNDNGDILGQLRDASSGSVVKNIWFNKNFPAQTLDVMSDISGNSISELGVLGVHDNGSTLVQLRDTSAGSVVSNIWYND